MDKWETDFLREIVELDTNSDEKKNYAICAETIKGYCEEAGLKVEVFDSLHDGINGSRCEDNSSTLHAL